LTDPTVLIVDDEPLARQVVRTLLAAHPTLTVVGECRKGVEAVAAIHALEPQLVFLDVQMPELDGFGVLRAVGAQCPPVVVLVTAYDEFAVRAFEAEALDFLVKPFTDDRFHQAVHRACRRLELSDASDLARRLSLAMDRMTLAHAAPDAPSWRTQFVVTSGVRAILIPAGAITWIEADDYYARLHVGQHSHLHRRSLTALAGELDPRQFVRIHRSALVNLAHLREVVRSRKGGLTVVLRDGTRLDVSERRRSALLRAIDGATPARSPNDLV
jgi:two-component system LytT family response regulator